MNSSCNVSLYNDTTNSSCGVSTKGLPPWYSDGYNVTMVVLYTLVIVAALVGNILVCIAVYINPNLRQNVASYFIVSLAVSDIGTASFAMPFDAQMFTMYGRWYHGEVLCIVWTTAYLITVPSSIWNLFIMSIDRYKTLKNPWNRFKESHSMTARRAIVTILALWVYCLVIALLPITGWKPFQTYSKSVHNNYCRFNIAKYFSITGSFVNFYLPMFAMCGIYYKVYQIARAHTKFPLALENRFHKVSAGNLSQTASTPFPGDSLSRPSFDQQQSHDSENKQDNDTIGLENVSFYFDDNSANNPCDESFGAKKDAERSTVGGHGKLANPTGDRSARGFFESTIKAEEQYCTEEQLHLKKCKPNDKEISFRQHEKHKKDCDDYCSLKCKKEKRGIAESDTTCKSSPAKLMLSTRKISAVGERLSCLERDQSLARQSGLEKIPNDNIKKKTLEIPKPLTDDNAVSTEKVVNQDKTKCQNAFVKSSIDNALKDKERHFPSEKKLKHDSLYLSEDVCSLKKFRKKSDDDNTLSASGSEHARRKMNDSLSYSNKRRMKHFATNTKAARTISIIVCAFLGCWIPFTTISVSFNICGKPCYKLPGLKLCGDILLLLGYVNSAINPVLFSYQNMNFRNSYRKIGLFLLRCFNVCKDD